MYIIHVFVYNHIHLTTFFIISYYFLATRHVGFIKEQNDKLNIKLAARNIRDKKHSSRNLRWLIVQCLTFIKKKHLYFSFEHFQTSYCKLPIIGSFLLIHLQFGISFNVFLGSILPTYLYRFLVWTLLNISLDFSRPLFFEWSIFSKIESVNFRTPPCLQSFPICLTFFYEIFIFEVSESNLQLKLIDSKIITCFRWVSLFVA